MAEPKAMLRGLRMARDLDVKKVGLQADSMVMVDILRGNGTWNPAHKLLITQCKEQIAQEGWEVKVSHCYRKEANQVGDRLAKLWINKELGVVYFSSPPKEALDVLNADAVRAAWHRNF